MTKRRRDTSPASPVTVDHPPARTGVPVVAAIAVLVLAAVLAWASRGNLSPDGVSYLDLADQLRLGDLAGFVQGYWSPAYPVLLAVVLSLTDASGHHAAVLAHLLNFLIAAATVALIWHAGRTRPPAWGRLLLTAFLVCSARTVRVDAVTPDLLLLLAVTGFGLELLRDEGWRGTRLGLWAGAAFLAKTSSWPWLLVAGAILAWHAWPQPRQRRQWRRAAAIAVVPVLAWTGLVSIDAGRATIGGAAAHNACWYLRECDGRSPDTHQGDHAAYSQWLIASDAGARVATFDAGHRTYQPWSDPDSWQRGIVSQHDVVPTVLEYLSYAGRQAGLVLGIWLPLLVVLVLLPAIALTRGKPAPRRPWLRSPPGIAVLLGGAGIAQFVAVHAEPRLIAPFAMLGALGVVTWAMEGKAHRRLASVAGAGLVVALAIGAWHVRDQLRITGSSASRARQLEQQHPPAGAPHRVAVIGDAFPLLPDLYRARAVVVVQVMSPEPADLERWAPEAQQVLIGRLRQLGAETIWLSRGRDSYSIVRPRPAQ